MLQVESSVNLVGAAVTCCGSYAAELLEHAKIKDVMLSCANRHHVPAPHAAAKNDGTIHKRLKWRPRFILKVVWRPQFTDDN
jgi:hypothetical protein